MKNNKEIYKKANGFDKNPQNINREGRPKKIYTILKEKGYCKDDFTTAISELFWYNITDLKKVYEDDTKPVIVKIIANQLYLALKNGEYNKIKDLAEQWLGKPNQKIEQKIEQNNNIDIDFEPKEIDNIIKKLNGLC